MKASRTVLLRDVVIFCAKLSLDGLKDAFLIQLSIATVIIDLFFGGKRKRLFYKVMQLGERFDLWLNLHGALEGGDGSDDGLFGASRAGSNTMLGQLEQMIRGGDEPRGHRKDHRQSDSDTDL